MFLLPRLGRRYSPGKPKSTILTRKRFHAFRHTVASVLLANGADIVTVSKQLGHASIPTTESFYSHIIEENKAKAADCIANVLIRKKA